MKTISFDGRQTIYSILDDNVIHTFDVTSTYSSMGTVTGSDWVCGIVI